MPVLIRNIAGNTTVMEFGKLREQTGSLFANSGDEGPEFCDGIDIASFCEIGRGRQGQLLYNEFVL